jgi:type IV secretory pathway VirB2 component (pilin)
MGKFVLGVLLGVLLGVANFAFAETSGSAGAPNPLCSMVEALSKNWGVITVLVMVILGGMVVVAGVMNLVQGKFAFALAVVIGGTVLLVAAFRLLSTSGDQLSKFASSCQQTQIEFLRPVAKIE